MATITPEELLQKIEKGESLKGMDLSKIKLKGCTISNADFEEADLEKANFSGCTLKEVNFKNANLKKTRWDKATVSDSNFSGSNMEGSQCKKALFQHVQMEKTTLKRAWLEKATIQDSLLNQCDLSESQASGAVFKKTSMAKAILNRAEMEKVCLEEITLDEANLTEALLSESKLQSVTLAKASLERTDLEMSELKNVDFSAANLVRANLSLCLLENVGFQQSDMTKASLTYCEAKEIKLENAVLVKTNFRGAKGLDEELRASIQERGGKVSKELLKKGWRSLKDRSQRALKDRSEKKAAEKISATGTSLNPEIPSPSGATDTPVQKAPPATSPVKSTNVIRAVALASLILGISLIGITWMVLTTVNTLGEKAYDQILGKMRFNKGLPVATSHLERLDEDSLLYLERGFVNILKWDGNEMELTKRYRIEYDEPEDFYYLGDAMKHPHGPRNKQQENEQ